MFDLSEIKLTKKDIEKGVNLPTEVSEDLAYLSGFLAGDGSFNIRIKKYEYSMKAVGNPKDEINFYNEIIVPIFKKLFNIDVKPRLYDGNTTYGIRIYSKSIFMFFTQIIGIPSGYKSGKINIPKIFNNDKLVASFIRGFADADFSLCIVKSNYPIIKGVSKSKQMIIEISNFLKRKEIKFWIKLDYVHLDSRIKSGKTIENLININGRKNLQLWMKYIGFKMPKILEKYEKYKVESSGAKI